MDALNHMLGQYIAFAVNSPKKYPRQPFLKDKKIEEEKRVMTDEEMERIARVNTIKLGGKLNKDGTKR